MSWKGSFSEEQDECQAFYIVNVIVVMHIFLKCFTECRKRSQTKEKNRLQRVHLKPCACCVLDDGVHSSLHYSLFLPVLYFGLSLLSENRYLQFLNLYFPDFDFKTIKLNQLFYPFRKAVIRSLYLQRYCVRLGTVLS